MKATDERLEEAKGDYQAARSEIIEYIEESCQRRVALAGEGHIRQVFAILSAEMCLAGAFGQIDTVLKLGKMAERLMHAEATLLVQEEQDYQRRFGEGVEDSVDTALRP